jgi:hypothetical protein
MLPEVCFGIDGRESIEENHVRKHPGCFLDKK